MSRNPSTNVSEKSLIILVNKEISLFYVPVALNEKLKSTTSLSLSDLVDLGWDISHLSDIGIKAITDELEKFSQGTSSAAEVYRVLSRSIRNEEVFNSVKRAVAYAIKNQVVIVDEEHFSY